MAWKLVLKTLLVFFKLKKKKKKKKHRLAFTRAKHSAVIFAYNFLLHFVNLFSLFVVMLNRTMEKESFSEKKLLVLSLFCTCTKLRRHCLKSNKLGGLALLTFVVSCEKCD